MLLYILLICFLVLLIFSYYFFKKDIIQPAIIFIASYIVSIVSCIINIKEWGIDFQLNTFCVLLFGALEFVAVCILIHKIFNRNGKDNTEEDLKDVEENTNKKIPMYLIIISIIYCIVILIVHLQVVLEVAKMFGHYSNLSEALTLYKSNTSYSANYKTPHYLNFISKPIVILGYVFLYYYIKMVMYSKGNIIKRLLKNWYYLIPTITYMIFEFISSNRLSIISLGIAGVVITLVLYQEKNKRVIDRKKIATLLGIGIIAMLVFYFSASIIGRKNNNNFLKYITLYCGGSIECLDLYLNDEPIRTSTVAGEETFYYLLDNVNNYLHQNIKLPKVIHLEFRYNGKTMIGNVYTAYRRWYHDFGIPGIIILNAGMATLYQVLYEIIKGKIKNKKNIDLILILYSYIAFPMFLHPIDSYYTLLMCRATFITTIVMFIIIYYIAKNTDFYFENKKPKFVFKNKG